MDYNRMFAIIKEIGDLEKAVIACIETVVYSPWPTEKKLSKIKAIMDAYESHESKWDEDFDQ